MVFFNYKAINICYENSSIDSVKCQVSSYLALQRMFGADSLLCARTWSVNSNGSHLSQ